jgi:ASC-1-like (ASCH) protein
LEDRETQKNKLHADLNKLRSYEEIFKKHNHKEMLKKVQADIAEAEKALKEYE